MTRRKARGERKIKISRKVGYPLVGGAVALAIAGAALIGRKQTRQPVGPNSIRRLPDGTMERGRNVTTRPSRPYPKIPNTQPSTRPAPKTRGMPSTRPAPKGMPRTRPAPKPDRPRDKILPRPFNPERPLPHMVKAKRPPRKGMGRKGRRSA